MHSPTITIFTCSYDKPRYISDAINSVLNQTFKDFEYFILENSDDGVTRNIVHKFNDSRIRLVDIDYSEKERRRIYVESRLKNNYFPQAKGKFIMTLADDDVLEPRCFEEHLKEFEKDNNHMVNYHGYKIHYLDSNHPEETIDAKEVVELHSRPLLKIDGGSVMFKKDLLNKISEPYFKCNWHDAHISDGLFLNKMADVVPFYPIDKVLHTKRVTNVSVHTFIDNGGNPMFFRPYYGGEHPTLKLNKTAKKRVFLDVGGYKGDTVLAVMNYTKKFDEIYCFEPSPVFWESLHNIIGIKVEEFGLWKEDSIKELYNSGSHRASLFKDKFNNNVSSGKIKLVKASTWFKENIKMGDEIFLKLNCEGAECDILDDLFDSGEYKKISALMVDFDVRKVPSQKHRENEIREKLKTHKIPAVYIVEGQDFHKWTGKHEEFTHHWLDETTKQLESSKK